MPRIEANCPTCGTPIESWETTGGWSAHTPGIGTRVGTGEAPSEIAGMPPTITANPDFDVMTIEPCGHVLRGSEIREVEIRKYFDIPGPLDLTAGSGEGLKASAAEGEHGGAFLSINGLQGGEASVLSRADVVVLRDWLTRLIDETA